MTLKKGIIASQRSMRQKKVRFCGKRNLVEARLAKNKLFTRAVNKPAEWREIHSMIKKIAEGGVYKNEMRELADRLAHGNESKTITHKEGRLIAEALHEEFYPELKKYKSSRNSPPQNGGTKTFQTSPQNAGFRTSKTKSKSQNISEPKENKSMTPMKMASIMNKARANFEESEERMNGEQLKSGFSRALEATEKNKGR